MCSILNSQKTYSLSVPVLVTQIQTAEVLEQTEVRLTVVISNVFAKNEESEALLSVLQYQSSLTIARGCE